MAFEQNGQKYYDTQPTGEVNTTVDYTDPTDVPKIDEEIKNGVVGNVEQGIASWIRNEMGRKHVREALARSVEYFSVLFNKLEVIIYSNTAKQNNVEQRQSKLERDFITRISNATVNSEIINARKSDVYGQFNILDLRVENIESIMANFVPSGFIVKINHSLGRNPTVTVKKYDWAIGTEPTGFDTAPDGLFGGGAVETVPTNLIYANGVVYVHMPLVYKQGGKFILQSDKELLLIDGTHTLNFEIEGGLTDVTIPDEPINNIPINHTAYAYSADGTDGFTTVYPNLNLLDGTSSILKTVSTKSWGTSELATNTVNFEKGKVYTYSAWVQDCDVDSRAVLYLYDSANTTYTNVGNTIKAGTSGFSTITFTVSIDVARYKAAIGFVANQSNLHNLSYSKLKLEEGLIATPHMPSASEVTTADWPSYFGQYTDFTKADSTNPSDYNWNKIPR